jgi:hypothetical protein
VQASAQDPEFIKEFQYAMRFLNLDFELGRHSTGQHWPAVFTPRSDGYKYTADTTNVHSGKYSGRIENALPGKEGHGLLTGRLPAKFVAGKRIRFSGYLKLDRVTDYAGLWLAAFNVTRAIASNDAEKQGATGTQDWKKYEFEIDIPQGATTVNFGFIIVGGGTVWADDLDVEIIGDAAPTPILPAAEKDIVEEKVSDWLKVIDDGKYEESWSQAAEKLKASVTQENWENQLKSRAAFGGMVTRKARSAEYTTQLTGEPDGDYVLVIFDSSFEKKRTAVETVVFMKEKDGTWRPAGYYIR